MSTVDVTGHSPLSFTNEDGSQRFVPLSALELVGSELKLKAAWAAEFSNADQATLLAVASTLKASRQLEPPPLTAPRPAIGFTAATAGPEGDNIVVTLTPDPGTVTEAQVLIQAVETDTYSGLTDAAAAAMKIGVDNATGNPGDPPAGTGLVHVKAGGTTGTGLPKNNQNLTVKGATTNVLAADASTTLFQLVPRSGAPPAGIPVKVTVDSAAGTFTVEASYDTGSGQPKVPLTALNTLAAPITFVVTAAPAPSGLARPKQGDVRLSGGAPGIAATGVAYTS